MLPENSEPILRFEDVAVAAAGVRLLEGISMVLSRSQRLALTGPSGCGKTTFLRTVCGLIDPADGTIYFDGRRPAEVGWPQFRRQVILVEQQPVLLDTTVRRNLERPFEYHFSKGDFPVDRAKRLLDELKVGSERLDQNARSLSVGQRQRISLIRAILVEPAVFLLDEPTSAIDKDTIVAVENSLRQETERLNAAALIVSHDRAQAERLGHRSFDLTRSMVQEKRVNG